MYFRTLFIAKRFVTQVCNAPMNIEIGSAKIIEIAGQGKDFQTQRVPYFKGLWVGFLAELANVKSAFSGLRDLNFRKFGYASFEDFSVGDDGVLIRRDAGRYEEK
jgi:hypothetical protein